MKKNKTEIKNKSEAVKVKPAHNYAQILSLLSVALGEKHDQLSAYVMAPAKGHGFAFAVVYGTGSLPTIGIMDISTNSSGDIVPGAFDALVSQGARSYSQALGFFERFTNDESVLLQVKDLYTKGK